MQELDEERRPGPGGSSDELERAAKEFIGKYTIDVLYTSVFCTTDSLHSLAKALCLFIRGH